LQQFQYFAMMFN